MEDNARVRRMAGEADGIVYSDGKSFSVFQREAFFLPMLNHRYQFQAQQCIHLHVF